MVAGPRSGDAVRVRSNMASNIRSTYAMAALVCSIALSIGEVAAQIIVLFITWEQSCQQPLRLWVIVRVVLQMMSFPLSVFFGANDAPREEEAASASQRATLARLSTALNLCSFGWFIVGNVWTLQAESCAATSPHLYRLCLALIIVFYCLMALPYIFGLCLLCCLPFFIVSFSRIAEQTGIGGRGATRETITRLRTLTFHAGSMPKEDAVCVVCLSEYEEGEPIRGLPCGHLYHSNCIDRWLVINKACPLCQRDVDEIEA
eukprot:tig00000402_g179.t1